MNIDELHSALRSQDGIAFSYPDGSSLRIIRTCCAWEHPERQGPHGMHVGGHKPYWGRLGDGEWFGLNGRSEHRMLYDIICLWEIADNAQDLLEAIR